MDTDDFEQLPRSVQRQIDVAFDKARRLPQDPVSSGLVPPAAKKHLAHDDGEIANYHSRENSEEAGGFLLDDDAGGFLKDDETVLKPENDYSLDDSLALSMIPAALQLLDLPPDDEDVLETFRNAAGGWGNLVDGEQGVARKDWREVCAILVQNRAGGEDVPTDAGDSGGGFLPEDEDLDLDALVESDANDDSEDEYRSDDDDERGNNASGHASSGDEYGVPATRSAKGKGKSTTVQSKPRRKTRRRRSSSASSSESPPAMTQRQRAEARKTFALFFPDVPNEKLTSQRIKIKDVGRVASVLSVKLKTEEIMEMLEAFSTSADKSIGLTDFETLVMTARLV